MNDLISQVSSKNLQILNEFKSGNAASLVSSYYEEDASLVTPDGNAISGLTEITQFFATLLQNGQDSLDVRPLPDSPDASVRVAVGTSGDLICVLGGYAVSLTQDVEALPEIQALATQGSGNRVVVFRRGSSGLKAVIDIFA